MSQQVFKINFNVKRYAINIRPFDITLVEPYKYTYKTKEFVRSQI